VRPPATHDERDRHEREPREEERSRGDELHTDLRSSVAPPRATSIVFPRIIERPF
jgi:hypothetical protein